MPDESADESSRSRRSSRRSRSPRKLTLRARGRSAGSRRRAAEEEANAPRNAGRTRAQEARRTAGGHGCRRGRGGGARDRRTKTTPRIHVPAPDLAVEAESRAASPPAAGEPRDRGSCRGARRHGRRPAEAEALASRHARRPQAQEARGERRDARRGRARRDRRGCRRGRRGTAGRVRPDVRVDRGLRLARSSSAAVSRYQSAARGRLRALQIRYRWGQASA